LVVPSWAHARAVDDPDLEIAQRHFASGTKFYQHKRYAPALREFQAARVAKPVPELDYNIARCLDRMERYADALTAYERYIDARANASDGPAVRERIAALKTRVPTATAKPKAKADPVVMVAAQSPTSPLVGTHWTVTSTDHQAATFRFLEKGQLTVQSSPKIAKRCSWKQAGQELVTECGSEGVTWLVSADRMFGQSASLGWSAQRSP
jgi:tetratricopeptide (TPR) repeat protein